MASTDSSVSSITVTVRVRPFTTKETAQVIKVDDGTLFLGDGSLAAAPIPKLNQRGIRCVIKVVDDRCLVFDPPEDNPVQKFSRSVVPSTGKKVKDQVFAFDRIFDSKASQVEVYEGTSKPLLDNVLDGFNATVFAYGATGCGKTHTITGTAESPGIIFLTMQELFEKITERSDDKVTELSLSYLEIYNETIRDLLVPGGSKQGLMLREDSHQAVSVAGLTSHHPRNVQEVMDMIVTGNEHRTVSPTEANAVSSRSHAVLQINVAQRDRNAGENEPHTMATLSIIDLAGSERASATKNRGERLIEGANINKSLLALGSCINALCDPRKKNHVPYRNSKLTRLLKFTLGGNCKTVMIVCVSPSSAHFDETQNTLRYANRAKNIQTKVTRNVFNVNRHVKDYLVKIDEQMAMIKELKAQQKDAEQVLLAKLRKQQVKRDGLVRESIARLRTAYEGSASERRDKMLGMQRLKAFERRIGLLSAWIASFDAVCDERGGEEAMPSALAVMRKTAHGILVELEHSRQHMHQKLERCRWERAVDSALQHGLSQLGGDGASSERDALVREAELVKSNFLRDAYHELLEQDRAGDAAAVQNLLTAQFSLLCSLSETFYMTEGEAVAHAKTIIDRLLQMGYKAASQTIKPDGLVLPAVTLAPTKTGTPKRRRLQAHARPVPPPACLALSGPQHQALASPVKNSPRRRRAAKAAKSVSFPLVKKSPARRRVRWRDDESEEGALADFEKTPQKLASSPEHPSPPKAMFGKPAQLDRSDDESSPSLRTPAFTTDPPAKPSRFQAGFLAKSAKADDSPKSMPRRSPIAPSLSLPIHSSDSEDRPSPLRTIPVSRVSNARSSPQCRPSQPSPTLGPTPYPHDENDPACNTRPLRGSESDAEVPSARLLAASDAGSLHAADIDPLKLRSALYSSKRRDRLSFLMGVTAASNAKRVGSLGSDRAHSSGAGHGLRPWSSYSGAPLASATNGITRRRSLGRRASTERRRSPPAVCSPDGSVLGGGGLPSSTSAGSGPRSSVFVPGQARRMNMGGSVSGARAASPREPFDSRSRRVTISSATGQSSGSGRPRASLAWR